ncbi:MAG: DEAD/DEAH box helicase family protein [Chloroflexi bacterium]|nr:DEAD/DEAH box helicase family protein [Chloroflexota bacterium]
MNKTYVALDTETTGFNSESDSIIEVAVVKFRGDQILDSWSSLVNPGRDLPLKIERLTGIKPEDVRTAPRIEQVGRHIARFVGEHPVVGHSVEHDIAFMRQQNLLLTNPTVDTDELARIVMPHAARYSLKQLAAELDIPLPDNHRALADAQAAMRLFLALCQRAAQLDTNTLNEIVRAAQGSHWGLRDVFKEVLRFSAGRSAFSGASIGAQLRAKGAIKNNRLLVLDGDAHNPPPALRPALHHQALDGDEILGLFDADGALAEQFAGYERRDQQVQMLQAVCEAFDNDTHLLVEAGTGTGKSMAYLVPAIHFAVANGRPIVVSTNTINLQDQLIEKDIPDLQKILGLDFRAVVMKGRSNYLCRHRFEQFQQQPHKSPMQIRVLARILAWLPTTTTGDRAELSLTYEEEAVWGDVCADETCNAQSCPYFQQGSCFFFRARQQAEGAHIIVVNHALLLSDMATQNHILPEHHHLIIDEAHHLEARATEAFSVEVQPNSIETLLAEVGTARDGLLAGLAAAVRAGDATASVKDQLADLIQTAYADTGQAQRDIYPLFNHLTTVLPAQNSSKGEYDTQIRLVPALRAQPAWSTAEVLCDALTDSLGRITGTLERLGRLCAEHDALENDDLLYPMALKRQRLSELRANLTAIVCEPLANGIYWATLRAGGGDVRLNSAPLHVGEMLQKQIFSQKDCVILTSATLRSADGFRFIRDRLGLGEVVELGLDSPFDYRKSTLLYLPTDVPEPDTVNYAKVVHETLVELCKATQGRALILFTSKSQLLRTYEAIRRPLEQADIIVMGQYMDGSRRQLLDNFRSMSRCVLLGTRSFWEGVDVIGDALSCLVITRLPFAVPSDPIIAARSETFDDSFNDYMVPQAVLSFRQGFGRLIRSATDRGVAVILDKRLLTKAYGKAFLASLPDCTERRASCKDAPTAAAQWLK